MARTTMTPNTPRAAAVLVALLAATATASATAQQIAPAADLSTQASDSVPVTLPQDLPPPVDLTPSPQNTEAVVPSTRSGMFQRLTVNGTWISSGGADGMGMSDVELKAIFALPCPTREWPLLITPGVAEHWLDAPGTDLPTRLGDTYIDFRWLPKLTPRLMLDLAVTPGVYRDFDQHTDDGLRITSHAAGVWTWTPTAKLVLGASYLDRSDLNVIPIGGLIWTPTPDWQLDLLFPQPKIWRRLHSSLERDSDAENWVYVAGEFGDWAWAVRRSNGTLDTAEYRDARLLLGVERKVHGGLNGRLEVGYVFSRKLRYTSGEGELDPHGAVLLRAGVDF
jgi:hypothetical protein